MTEVTIKSISKILVDENGYNYIDVVLSNGVQGYYPNSQEALGLFKKGDRVKYRDTKEFAGREKINGLTKILDMVTTKIKKIGPVSLGNNGTWYADIQTDDDVIGIHFSDSKKDLSTLKVGTVIKYSDTKEIEGKGTFFVGLNKVVQYSPDERRQLSIVRQSSIKAAIEILSIASPKGRWVKPDGSVDSEGAVNDVISISELLIDYAMVE